MDNVWSVSLRALIGFGTLLLLVRILGKKQIGQMTFFSYISGFALGDIVGDMIVIKEIRLLDALVGMVVWTLLAYAVEVINLKSANAKLLLDGEPTIVIRQGKILETALKKSRLSIDDLTMLLRNKDIFSVMDIDFAILEPNGNLSVLKKPEMETVTKGELHIPVSSRISLPLELIVDGNVIKRNLRIAGLQISWLYDQLKKEGLTSVNDVFYAQLQSDGTLFIDKRRER